jgi:hypothetical protein
LSDKGGDDERSCSEGGESQLEEERRRKIEENEPPTSEPPARSASVTIPSLINIGYFSLLLISSLSAAATSFRPASNSLPCNTIGDSGSRRVDEGDEEEAEGAGEEKSDRTRLTTIREASERRRVSSVREMRERTWSRGRA